VSTPCVPREYPVSTREYPVRTQAAYFVPPTVFVDVPTDAPVWREEIFGARERTSALGARPSSAYVPSESAAGTPVAMRCDHAAWDIRCRSRAAPVLRVL
jgi:hypothetical protein